MAFFEAARERIAALQRSLGTGTGVAPGIEGGGMVNYVHFIVQYTC